MELGFETIGNATCNVIEKNKSVLTTDPWVTGSPYFNSWTHSHKIPELQRSNIYNSRYTWISHGHPDHLDINTLNNMKKTKVLLPDHYGERIKNDLMDEGFNVKVIKSGKIYKLSDSIEIISFSDYNQDACLLVMIGRKDLIININDGSTLGFRSRIRSISKNFENKFLLALIGSVDADMNNFYNEQGDFIQHSKLKNNHDIGKTYSKKMRRYNCNFAIPFSSHHQYQRDDSAHMNEYIVPLKNHYDKFDKSSGDLLPPFIRWDSIKSNYEEIKPEKIKNKIFASSSFGDNWSDDLDINDKKKIDNYFSQIGLLNGIGAIHFQCGNSQHTIKIGNLKEEVYFNAPRFSLMEAFKYNVFDDILIGNYVKTTLVNFKSLYPLFCPIVPKYFDNGRVKNEEDFKSYMNFYEKNSPNRLNFKKELMQHNFRKFVISLSTKYQFYNLARSLYRTFTTS